MLYRLFSKYVPRSRRNKYTRAIRQFVNSDDTVLTFPATLNTIERRWIHNIAEQWKILNHESFGSGEERYIVVTKKTEGNTFKYIAYFYLHKHIYQMNRLLISPNPNLTPTTARLRAPQHRPCLATNVFFAADSSPLPKRRRLMCQCIATMFKPTFIHQFYIVFILTLNVAHSFYSHHIDAAC